MNGLRLPLSAGIVLAAMTLTEAAPRAGDGRIDRRALVMRHNPELRELSPSAPLSVGNGQFAFTVDVTGLQSLADVHYAEGIPLETLARWAWHSEPNPFGYALADTNTLFDSATGPIGLPTKADGPAGEWLRRNPHGLPLARIALEGVVGRPRPLRREDLSAVDQVLDLWSGVIRSSYRLWEVPVLVHTAAHPERDVAALRIQSDLVRGGRLQVRVAFPRGHRLDVKNTPPLDFTRPEAHETRAVRRAPGRLDLERILDATRFRVALVAGPRARVVQDEACPHEIVVTGEDRSLELTLAFAPEVIDQVPSVDNVLSASRAHWPRFWQRGGALDLSGSRDPRARELERRVVLSQYLTAIQSVAKLPPQESGLTCNTWYGKHHTEMIWWHAAHFALWGREDLLATNLEWYLEHLPVARRIAAQRGLRGARWPKMVGPEGRESPGGNPLIIWNQPHPIHLCELVYRNEPTAGTLARYRDLVLDTAEAMASMAHLDVTRGRFVLGPPLWIAQEIYDPRASQNPSFELAYWAWGLATAQRWRERLGMDRLAEWDDIVGRLAPLPVKDGLYVALESHPDTFDNLASRHDHPTMLAPLGLLPGNGVDVETMRRTLHAVLDRWDFEAKIWGWDYPMIAMTAARVGEPDAAIDVLLRDGPNNVFSASGHCPQRSDMLRRPGQPGRNEIATYLPANGALLSAVAMMAAGWDGAPRECPAPGFPRDGRWRVRFEGLRPLP
jgi:hypothetical protein